MQTPVPHAVPASARLAYRSGARKVRIAPGDAAAHLERLVAALDMQGAEPAQGALADLYASMGPDGAALKRTGLGLVQTRLAPHVRRAFEALVGQPAVDTPSPLATRWSVIAQPSADISTRARRCSPDDSRAIANEALRAIEAADHAGVAAFLEHCLTCRDNLAFMLVRRATLKAGGPLPEGWDAVAQALEHAVAEAA